MSDMSAGVPATPAAPVVNNLGLTEAINEATGKTTSSDFKAAAPKAPASTEAKDAKEVKEAIRKIKIGEDEYTDAELKTFIEKGKGAEKKFLEASKRNKEAIRFFKMAKENPREFLAKTGLDPKKFAYDEVAEDLKNKLRDPKEVELETAQKRLKEYEAKEAEARQKALDADNERKSKALEQRFHKEMIDAMESFPELPKNASTVAALAAAISLVREKTGVLLTAKEVAPKVVNDLRKSIAGVVKGASAEQLLELIGEEGMAALRKYDIAKLKNPLTGQTTSPDAAKPKLNEKKMRANDFWKSF